MARVCDVCGRGPQKSIQRSHANNKTIVRQFINLQFRTINGQRKKVCTKCWKTLKKKIS